MTSTLNCVWCLKPATVYCGHVLDANAVHIVAGWCDECNEKPGAAGQLDSPECAGGWTVGMGICEYTDEEEEMTPLHQVEEQIDVALAAIREASELLSLTDVKEASIGGALYVLEVGLETVSEVIEHVIVERS